MKVYIATSLNNESLYRQLRERLAARGHTITYDWLNAGGLVTTESGRPLRARQDAAGVYAADLVIVALPGGFGTHTELGIAIGLALSGAWSGHILLWGEGGLDAHGPHPNVFYRLPTVPEQVGEDDTFRYGDPSSNDIMTMALPMDTCTGDLHDLLEIVDAIAWDQPHG